MAEGCDLDTNNKCRICLSLFTEPRLLSCYHIFCTPCLEELAKNKTKINCPLCRTSITLPENGIADFKVHPFFITTAADKTSEASDICQLCSEGKSAKDKCVECNTTLCLDCSIYHKKLKNSQNHTLESLVPYTRQPKSHMVCALHRNDLCFYCKPCNRVICSTCCATEHNQHLVQTVKTSAQMKRYVLTAKNASLKSRIQILENAIEDAQMQETVNSKISRQVKKEILSHAAGLKEVFCKSVDLLAEKSMGKVDNISKADLKIFQTYQNDLETEKISISNFSQIADNIINIFTDEQFLEEYLSLECKLDRILHRDGIAMPSIHKLTYECGNFKESTVSEMFGVVNSLDCKDVVRPVYRRLPLPSLDGQPILVHSFNIIRATTSMVPSKNNNVWLLFDGDGDDDEDKMVSFNSIGNEKPAVIQPKGTLKVLHNAERIIWFWMGMFAEKLNEQKKTLSSSVQWRNRILF